MARKSEIKISWQPFEVTDYTYPKGSKKEGQTTKRVKFADRSIDALLQAFSGSKDSLLKFVESKLSAVYVAQMADPDAAFRVPAKRLLAIPGYFAAKGLTPADPEKPTKDEIRKAIAILKGN